MNYIKEINAFYNELEVTPLSTSAIALWYALMHICNKTGWKREFSVAVGTLSLKSGLSERSVSNARNELKTKGFIDFKSRGGNKAAIYQLISLSANIADNFSDITSGNLSDSNSDSNSDSVSDNASALFKQNKTKQAIADGANAGVREDNTDDQGKNSGEVPILSREGKILSLTDPDSRTTGESPKGEVPELHHEDFLQIEQLAVSLLQRPVIRPDEYQMLKNLLASGVPISTIMQGIREAFDHYQPRRPRDKINSLTYCKNYILDLHEKLTYRAKPIEPVGRMERGNHQRGDARASGENRTPAGQYSHLRGGRWTPPEASGGE